MVRLILSVLLAGGMALGVAGCGDEAETPKPPDKPTVTDTDKAKAGDAVDDATKKAGDAVDDLKKKADDATE